jgi:LysM repeat protein
MNDEPELQINDDWSDRSVKPSRRKQLGDGRGKSLSVLLVILLILICAGGVFYFLSHRPAANQPNPLEPRVAALEQKIGELERQLTDLQGKASVSGPDPALLRRLDTLAQKVEALEKQEPPAPAQKATPSASPKPAMAAEKQYHIVQKGETLIGISRKYKISVDELRKLNRLSPDRPLRAGQKLQVSPAR